MFKYNFVGFLIVTLQPGLDNSISDRDKYLCKIYLLVRVSWMFCYVLSYLYWFQANGIKIGPQHSTAGGAGGAGGAGAGGAAGGGCC